MASDKQKKIICKDCKYANIKLSILKTVMYAYCTHPCLAQIDSVTGEDKLTLCYEVNINGKCSYGEKGKALIEHQEEPDPLVYCRSYTSI